MSFFEPESTKSCSIIRLRTQATLPDIYSHVRSVKDLGREGFCDPHDPCCLNRDPEVFLHQDVLRSQARKQCVPKNPFHFEYTILHRVKMKNRLRMAAERQQNPDLTAEEIERIREQEAGATTAATRARIKPTYNSSAEYFAEHPEIIPPSPGLINGGELKKALEGLTSVALAHEIALNKDFKLVKPVKKSDSKYQVSEEEQTGKELETSISKETQLAEDAKDRYWKMVDHVLLTKSLKDAKNTLLDLMKTLKTMLQATMLPHNLRLRLKTDNELDLKKIGKEIDREAFDISHYMDFILDTLSALCCPIHDREILKIRNMEVPSYQIRECIDLMESMNLDMANFIISQSRKQVLQNCVMYERNNFANYIETVYKMGKDPLRITRKWVRRHTIPERSFSETMAHCFAELLTSEEEKLEMPETLTLDWHRFPHIQNEIRRITIIGAVVSAVYDYSHSLLLESPEDINDFEKSQIATLKNLRLLSKLRTELNTVVQIEDIVDKKKLDEALERCWTHALFVLDEHLVKEKCEGLTLQQSEYVIGLIRPMNDWSHPSRSDFHNRVKEWFVDVAKEDGREKIQATGSLSIVGPQIIVPITEMMRICMYNRGVYDILYREIFVGKCQPPTLYPPKLKEPSTSDTIVLDANKYGESDKEKESGIPLDEGIMNLVSTLKEFSGRSIVYKRSNIDPRIKPMFEADGTPIIPPEQQPDYRAKEMNAIEQKHLDEYLLAHEPTLEEDYDGVYVFNVGDPDWMFGYTTEQLLKLMERENLINANKLRRIKERLYQEVLEKRVTNDLPIFQKIWREEVGTLQKEFCRLQRILVKGPTALPEGASDEPSAKRVFPGACELKPQPEEEIPKFTKKGERILYSRGRGAQFGRLSSFSETVEDPEGMDLERFEVYLAEEGEDEDPHARRGVGGRRPYDDRKSDYVEPRQRPETPMQLLSRNILVGIERGKTRRLNVGGLRIQVQKSFEKSLLPPPKDFRKPKPNPFVKQKKKSKPRMNYYAGSHQDDTQFDLPTEHISRRDLFRGTRPVPLLMLPEFQQRRATQLQKRHHRRQHQYQFHGVPMSRDDYMAKKRSFQFQIRPVTPGKPARAGGSQLSVVGSRNSMDSLKPFLGSVQEENTRKSVPKKVKDRISQLQQEEQLAPPPTTEDDEEQDNEEGALSDDDGQNLGKIRFDIPDTGEQPKDSNVKVKIKEKRPTSIRTTRFTVPEMSDDDRDHNRGIKIRNRRATSATTAKTVKTPRFSALPEKPLIGRKASEKIRVRRPTPMMLRESPMFAQLGNIGTGESREERQMQPLRHKQNQPRQSFSPLEGKADLGLYPKGVTPEVGIFSSMFRGRIGEKIQQRSKTPEINEVAQELKKSTIPTKGHRNHPPNTAPAGGDTSVAGSRVDLNTLTPVDDPQDDPGTGLMRIRKRRNIGRTLTPPFSRNERSNSMTVLDFRSSMFYKRSRSTLRKSDKEQKRHLMGTANNKGLKGAAVDKVRFS